MLTDNRLKAVVSVWLLQVAVVLATAWHDGGGFATGPVSVLVVEETSDRGSLTAGQLDIIGSHAPDGFLAWIKTHGEQDAGGNYRIVDKDDSLSQDDPKWQTAFQAKGASVPWLVVTRGGKVLLSEALPKEAGETLKVLKRLGGE